MISKKQVKHIAKLAKVSLSKKEVERFQKELSKILDYVEKLKEVDIEGEKPQTHSVWIENVMRGDEKISEFEFDEEKLTEQFSEREANFLKVKKIIQE
jgi:aspartyl-tRNA(Asn)/glutamyl-tRNA(Gln) amidotransferase subunit C